MEEVVSLVDLLQVEVDVLVVVEVFLVVCKAWSVVWEYHYWVDP